jgi:CBS domain-containing protein
MAQLQTVRDVMTPEPIVLDGAATVSDAAKAMKARDVGDVLVRSGGKLCGIVTDRDIVVRVLAGEGAATPPAGGSRRSARGISSASRRTRRSMRPSR